MVNKQNPRRVLRSLARFCAKGCQAKQSQALRFGHVQSNVREAAQSLVGFILVPEQRKVDEVDPTAPSVKRGRMSNLSIALSVGTVAAGVSTTYHNLDSHGEQEQHSEHSESLDHDLQTPFNGHPPHAQQPSVRES